MLKVCRKYSFKAIKIDALKIGIEKEGNLPPKEDPSWKWYEGNPADEKLETFERGTEAAKFCQKESQLMMDTKLRDVIEKLIRGLRILI